jgi:D-glycero-D-manno-heptose 1,7-bisphosphate phosphatase
MKHRALFLDRDGTLVHPRHYPSRPEELHLYESIGPGLKDIQEMGFRLVVITNQSGIARGYFTESDLQTMHEYLAEELNKSGVQLDGIYYCPHHPAGVIPGLAMRCNCRKPQPGMLLQAAEDLNLDLRSSWFVGDILDDIEAGNRVGCRTVLVDLGTEQLPTDQIRYPDFVARDTLHALHIIQTCEHRSHEIGENANAWLRSVSLLHRNKCFEADLAYRPPTWQLTLEPDRADSTLCT